MTSDCLPIFGAFAIGSFASTESVIFKLSLSMNLRLWKRFRFFAIGNIDSAFGSSMRGYDFGGGLLFEELQKRIWRRYATSLALVTFLLCLMRLEGSLTLESLSWIEATFVRHVFTKISTFTNKLIIIGKCKVSQIPMKIMVGSSSSSTSVCDNKHDKVDVKTI